MKLRFSLRAGPTYKQWQIKRKGEAGDEYIHISTDRTLIFHAPQVWVQPAAAAKIHNGETKKTVCAWLVIKEMHELEVAPFSAEVLSCLPQLRFNPEEKPFWVFDEGHCPHRTTLPYWFSSCGNRIFKIPECLQDLMPSFLSHGRLIKPS